MAALRLVYESRWKALDLQLAQWAAARSSSTQSQHSTSDTTTAIPSADGGSTSSTTQPPVIPSLRYQDIPWPLPQLSGQSRGAVIGPQKLNQPSVAGAGGSSSGKDSGSSDEASSQHLRELLLAGAESAGQIKLRLRSELLRWHPDKFGARLLPFLQSSERTLVLEHAHRVSQMLTGLLGGSKVS